ncbi:MAG TPA: YihY/virulence factor BrkB family protein [Vicinamibacterales bacterium]|nr:YihY/virulence factor BrkB family protein [Vicinamibacterales bacterium]
MLKAFRIPLTWNDLLKRTYAEVLADNCLGLAAQLSYYFFLALFPALLFLVALASFFPIANLMDEITAALARVAPYEALKLIQDQLVKISQDKNGGLLTIGMIGTIWSTSSGVTAVIDTLNQAYDITEGRPWWKVRLLSLGLTIALALFIIVSFGLVLVGPTLAEKIASWFYLGAAFKWAWWILQWPVVFGLVAFAIAMIYYFAPDAKQDWVWITPGSVTGTALWLLTSLGFKFYVSHFGSYNATYGTIGGIIVLLTWFYVSSLAILIGAELNAEIEHASPYGKAVGEKEPGEKTALGAAAERDWKDRHTGPAATAPKPQHGNCEVDTDLRPAVRPAPPAPRASDWIVSGVVLGEAMVMAWAALRRRLSKLGA